MALPCIIGRIGGKSKLKKIIVEDYFPKDYECMLYVEPFVGGGSIFFHKNPSVVEVINDLDKNVYTVFSGAKKYTHQEVANRLNKTYTKEEFNAIRDSRPTEEFDVFCRAFYIIKKSLLGNCSCWKDDRAKMTVKLEGYKERLEDVIIHNIDYKELIEKYDSPHTFFYLDPPYDNSKGIYKHHSIDMLEMFSILAKIKGKFLLSYNNSPDIRELFSEFYIEEIETEYTHKFKDKPQKKVVELLISNYIVNE